MKKIINIIIILLILLFSCNKSIYVLSPCYNMNENKYNINHSINYKQDNKKIIKIKKEYRKNINKERYKNYKKQQKNWK